MRRRGQAYQYELDGREVCPDPRSRFQPDGVQGQSRLVDISSFRWNDQGFQSRPLSSALAYELHVGTFSSRGTFEGVIEHLDHLVRLGVTPVELMPIAEFAGARGVGVRRRVSFRGAPRLRRTEGAHGPPAYCARPRFF